MGRELDALLQHNDAKSLWEQLWLRAHVVVQVLNLDSDTLRLEGHDGSPHVSPPHCSNELREIIVLVTRAGEVPGSQAFFLEREFPPVMLSSGHPSHHPPEPQS